MKENKAYFFKRFAAYFIDMLLVSIITSVLTYPFINNKTVDTLSEEYNQIAENYVNQKIDVSTYISQSIDISYEQAKVTGLSNIISIVILVLYFIVFQIYQSGQTIGKKIMKIKIVKNDDSPLTMNNMIVRELFNHFILLNIIICIITLLGKNAYFYGTSFVEVLQYVFIIVTIFMIMIRKDGRGLPDFMAGTKVIEINHLVEEEEVCEN